jgi:hypothetical protein
MEIMCIMTMCSAGVGEGELFVDVKGLRFIGATKFPNVRFITGRKECVS